MKQFYELVSVNPNKMTEGEKAFFDTHQSIMQSGGIASEFASKFAMGLKTMHDGKLYKEAGFATFDDYAETAVGIKRNQAYKYVKAVESLGDNFVSSKIQNVGITKLALLAGLDAEEREQITARIKVEDVTVSELKKRIKELETKNAELQDEIANIEPETQTVEKVVEKVVKDEKIIAELATTRQELAQIKAQRANATNDKEIELARLKKQLENASDKNFTIFNVKFNELQTLINDIIAQFSKLTENQQRGARQALKTVVGGLII